MAETNQQVAPSKDEIDLLELSARGAKAFGRLIKSAGRGFLSSFFFLLRNWFPVMLSIVAGIACSYLVKIISGPTYQSDIVLRSNVVATDEMIAYVNRLHFYSREANSDELAAALLMSKENSVKIKDIKASYIVDLNRDGIQDFVDYRDKFDVFDSTSIRMSDRINIRVKTKDQKIFSEIRSGLIDFINSDSLYQRRNRIRFAQNEDLLERLNYDILQLDSLQKVKYFEETRSRIPQGGSQIVLMQDQTTQLVYNDIYQLYSRKQLIEQEQVIYKEIVTVLSEFSRPGKPVNRMMYYGVFIIPSFFLVTIVLLLIKRHHSDLRNAYNKY